MGDTGRGLENSVVGTPLDLFTFQYQMESASSCQTAIDSAERDRRWFTSLTGENEVVEAYRDSQQLDFAAWCVPSEHAEIFSFVENCLAHYLNEVPCANNFPAFSIQERYNVLKYKPGQGYHAAHHDYMPGNPLAESRHLTCVVFLNTVEEGGELEFTQQSIQVRPVEGRTVIFPSGWTHTHRVLTPSEDRYVLQLWWSFNGGSFSG